ncbi:MAG: XdhC family protein [Pricia sp.]
MTHELRNIVQAFQAAEKKQLKTVLATVVALEGSSYRRPGVRMLLREDGKMVGAVSGGCVEKEVFRQSQSVFSDDTPKMMTYDGRYRLGCEGILYILIEPFEPRQEFLTAFESVLAERKSFEVVSHFSKQGGADIAFGSLFRLGGKEVPVRPTFQTDNKSTSKEIKGTAMETEIFEQEMPPRFKLVIIGAEHDAVQLCLFASLTGWEVSIIAAASEEKEIHHFPGAEHFTAVEPDMLSTSDIDHRTALMVMTHSYVRDLQYLLAIKDVRPAYLGLLGPSHRRERLLGDFIERYPQVSDDFIDAIHGPAGLNIGAETAQEIALAIMAEILSVIRNQKPMMLKNKSGRIHS